MATSRTIAGFVVVAAAACSDAAGPERVLLQDRLIFVSDRDVTIEPGDAANGVLYRMNEDGTGLVRIGPLSYYNSLRLSPDGRRLAFYNDDSGCYDIYVMGVEDTVASQLTGVHQFERCNVQPHWSPDGSKLAFTSSRNRRLGRVRDERERQRTRPAGGQSAWQHRKVCGFRRRLDAGWQGAGDE